MIVTVGSADCRNEQTSSDAIEVFVWNGLVEVSRSFLIRLKYDLLVVFHGPVWFLTEAPRM